MYLSRNGQREHQKSRQPADPKTGDHLGGDHEGRLHPRFRHRRNQWRNAGQQQHGHREAEADAYHRRRRGLAQSRQQCERRTDAGRHQHEGESPRRQRREQCGFVAGHEPPMAIMRCSSVWV